MAKATKETKQEVVKQQEKAVEVKPTVDNKEMIKTLLSDYNKLTKKSNGEGRRIRRKLRRLGYYLSKVNKK